MSKYSLGKDFRDLLSDKFNDNWNEFIDRTSGLIHKYNDDLQQVIVQIESPADLIPYYPYSVVSFSEVDARIVLSDESPVDRAIDNMEDLNMEYGVKDSFEPFNTDTLREMKRELHTMYQYAKDKQVNNIL